jgi:hypothetical protein
MGSRARSVLRSQRPLIIYSFTRPRCRVLAPSHQLFSSTVLEKLVRRLVAVVQPTLDEFCVRQRRSERAPLLYLVCLSEDSRVMFDWL